MKFFIGILILVFISSVFAKEISAEGLAELKRYQPIHDCYSKFLEVPGQSGQKNGKLVINLKLNNFGNVIETKEDSKSSSLHEDALNSCIFRSLKNLKFPKEVTDKEKEISVTLSFPIKNNDH